MRNLFVSIAVLFLSACVTAPTSPPPPQRPPEQGTQVPPTQPPPVASQGFRAPEIMQGPGLEGVIRTDAAALTRRFGQPRLDVVEGDARKLQFAGASCVLDVYLYPLQRGGQPVATWVQARRASDGQEVDRIACMQALSR